MNAQNTRDKDNIWLHVEVVNGRQRVVDQNGKVVGGVISSRLTSEAGQIATIEMEVEVAVLTDDGNIAIVIG